MISDDDVRHALHDIGYDITSDNLNLLLKEVLSNVAPEESFFDNGLIDLSKDDAPFFEELNKTSFDNNEVYDKLKSECKNYAEKAIKEAYDCIKRTYTHMLEIAEGQTYRNDRFSVLYKPFSHLNRVVSRESTSSFDDAASDNTLVAPEQIPAPVDPSTERVVIQEFMKDNCLRPIMCPEPGRLPFQQDRLRTMEKYKKEWALRPPPGENKRLALRWKIREALIKRDIPVIKLTEQDENVNLPSKPDWQ
ncbi:unnamed protein product [Bursaphelenchus okinawaensis]|uniref:Centriolar and ciliogenesis-associated protein HYLS1 C-terminal domain-containing protein n=1 Tax=Bursaphelenchus okinawaensis TaxID=465554 RepID=A0A811L957_9BILA|nr:unnamed protein product [Bursaphelenchus okinawaensis]CAG9120272.1 unnamed protein product [Bursaphelenchus okinawaensis]